MEKHDEMNNKNVPRSLVGDYGTSDSESEDIEGPSSGQIGSEEYDHTEHSEMVLKNNIINACAHGPLPRSKAERDVKTSTNMIIDGSDSDVVNYEVTEYRDVDSESYSTPSSDSSDDEGWIQAVQSNSSGDEDGENQSKAEPIKVHGELGLDDLPPIEDLAISLPAQETTKIGTILNIVDRLVIIRALPETPAVDLDSILFLDNGARALGKVFDVFGPVTEPHYCVRFNSVDHVKERGVQPGMDVYIAPRSRDHTNYVFLTELMKSKGSDASWLHDIEPPPSHVDFSDDEEERRANRARKEQNKKADSGETSKTISQPPKRDKRRNQRPSESSSRFGGYEVGFGRGGINPFADRRPTRFVNPWFAWDLNESRRSHNEFAPRPLRPPFNRPPMCAPPFDPYIPPPFVGDSYQFGGRPRMFGPMPPMSAAPRPGPVFGAAYCAPPPPPPQAQWARRPPPPPGT